MRNLLLLGNLTLIYLNVLFRAYNLTIKRITRSAIIAEINTKDVKLVKTNISSLRSKRIKYILCKCLLECKDKTLVFTNFTSLVLISTMIALLIILFINTDMSNFHIIYQRLPTESN